MNTINFKADNLQLETGQGVYDHEENEVVTIIISLMIFDIMKTIITHAS